MLVGSNRLEAAVDHTVQSECSYTELGTKGSFQLGERCDVAVDTSTMAVGPVVNRGGVAIVGRLDDVGGERRHVVMWVERGVTG